MMTQPSPNSKTSHSSCVHASVDSSSPPFSIVFSFSISLDTSAVSLCDTSAPYENGKTCVQACTGAADCSLDFAYMDEDNYSREQGACVYDGCNPDADCAEFGDYVCHSSGGCPAILRPVKPLLIVRWMDYMPMPTIILVEKVLVCIRAVILIQSAPIWETMFVIFLRG